MARLRTSVDLVDRHRALVGHRLALTAHRRRLVLGQHRVRDPLPDLPQHRVRDLLPDLPVPLPRALLPCSVMSD